MQVVPAVNTMDFEEIRKKIGEAKAFGASWIHFDISDSQFTTHLSWNNPSILKLSGLAREINIEAHLMVNNPDEVVASWIDAGVKRIVVHVEAVKDTNLIKEICDKAGVELFIAANPETSVEKLLEHGKIGNFFVLAVSPGPAGQKFDETQINKIKTLREKFPVANIEVDGGINLDTALRAKSAGATIIASASFIWNSANPKETFNRLSII